jgi:hypothetical protein
MATILTVGALVNGTASLCTAQTGNGVTTHIADRGLRHGPALLRIVTTVGATPTCTYLVEGSMNATDWAPAPIADPATPETVSVATFVITSATTTLKYLRPFHAWRFLRITFSSNTNVTNSVDFYSF